MRMQEPQESQEWQAGQGYGEYRASTGQYAAEQQQKIYPKQEDTGRLMTLAAAIVSVVLSCIGFAGAIVGIVGSGITLYYSGGRHYGAGRFYSTAAAADCPVCGERRCPGSFADAPPMTIQGFSPLGAYLFPVHE